MPCTRRKTNWQKGSPRPQRRSSKSAAKYLGPLRAAYLFDATGKLIGLVPKVEAAEHGSQVLAAIAALK